MFGQVAGMAMVDGADARGPRRLGMAIGERPGARAYRPRRGLSRRRSRGRGSSAWRPATARPSGHWVAPFGGRDGRISTNPIAFAWPVDGDAPGRRRLLDRGHRGGRRPQPAQPGAARPGGTLRDADGHATTDPGTPVRRPARRHPAARRRRSGIAGRRWRCWWRSSPRSSRAKPSTTRPGRAPT